MSCTRHVVPGDRHLTSRSRIYRNLCGNLSLSPHLICHRQVACCGRCRLCGGGDDILVRLRGQRSASRAFRLHVLRDTIDLGKATAGDRDDLASCARKVVRAQGLDTTRDQVGASGTNVRRLRLEGDIIRLNLSGKSSQCVHRLLRNVRKCERLPHRLHRGECHGVRRLATRLVACTTDWHGDRVVLRVEGLA